MTDTRNIPICTDPDCGCMTPFATTPLEALWFLSGRMKYAGISEGVGHSYARDIDKILEKPPARYFADGPTGSFYTDTQDQAEALIVALGADRDEWTVSDLMEGLDE